MERSQNTEADAADLQEQEEEVTPAPAVVKPDRAIDVPEADAIEQAMEVGYEDEEERS